MTHSKNPDIMNPQWPLDSHILGRMDQLAEIVSKLDDATANEKLPIPAINSLIVLLRHVGGSARYWLEHVCLGRVDVRDRDDEFSASGSVAEELKIYRTQRAIIADCLRELQGVDRAAPPALIPTDKDRWWCTSTQGVIVHVFHEAAQHLGHAEITRDALLAGLGATAGAAQDSASGTAGLAHTHLLDAVIAELRETEHAADFIDGERITTVDGLTLNLNEVVAAGVQESLRKVMG